MTALVTKTDLDGYKYVADSVKNSISWLQFVSEAQLLDVKIQIGDALLDELATQFAAGTLTADNEILLDGGTYVYLTNTYMFQGLKAAIIYYAFGRFTNLTSYNYTAAGIVVKESDFSTPVTDKVVQRMETASRLTADAIMCEVVLYLNRNYLLYPLWANSSRCAGRHCKDNRGIFKVIGD
ncbi:MAG TPA: hypothetical protein VMV77_08905 [Bacteroidales bacterium]|nr:hypothetical protein [Bacteroidales bacterium]